MMSVVLDRRYMMIIVILLSFHLSTNRAREECGMFHKNETGCLHRLGCAWCSANDVCFDYKHDRHVCEGLHTQYSSEDDGIDDKDTDRRDTHTTNLVVVWTMFGICMCSVVATYAEMCYQISPIMRKYSSCCDEEQQHVTTNVSESQYNTIHDSFYLITLLFLLHLFVCFLFFRLYVFFDLARGLDRDVFMSFQDTE